MNTSDFEHKPNLSKTCRMPKVKCIVLVIIFVVICIFVINKFPRLIVPEHMRKGVWEVELADIEKYPISNAVDLPVGVGDAIANHPKTSRNNKAIAYNSVSSDKRFHFRYEGKDILLSNRVNKNFTRALAISTDGKDLAYRTEFTNFAKSSFAERRNIYINNKEIIELGRETFVPDKYDKMVLGFSFSPQKINDRNRWLCVIGENNSNSSVESNAKVTQFVIEKKHREWVVADGVEHKKYNRVEKAQFSPDGNHIVYWAGEQDKGFILVIDGTETGEYYDTISWLSSISSNGKTIWAYIAGMEDCYRMYFGDTVSSPYESIINPSITKDGMHITYAAKGDDRWKIIHDENIFNINPIGDVALVEISPDGLDVAYIIKEGIGRMSLWINEDKIASHEIIKDFQFSPKGEGYAYIAGDLIDWNKILTENGNLTRFDLYGKWSVFTENESNPLVFDYITSLTYGYNNNHIAYIAHDGSLTFLLKDYKKSRYFLKVFGESEKIYSDDYCFRIIADDIKGNRIQTVEWYYRE